MLQGALMDFLPKHLLTLLAFTRIDRKAADKCAVYGVDQSLRFSLLLNGCFFPAIWWSMVILEKCIGKTIEIIFDCKYIYVRLT